MSSSITRLSFYKKCRNVSLDTDHLGPRGFLYTDSDLTMFVVIMEDAERSAMCALTPNTLDVLK